MTWSNIYKYIYVNLERIPKESFGVYTIWIGKQCLYVGKAKDQPIKIRLKKHYTKSHNEQLNQWFRSSHRDRMYFKYFSVDNLHQIDILERHYIRALSPLTNINYD